MKRNRDGKEIRNKRRKRRIGKIKKRNKYGKGKINKRKRILRKIIKKFIDEKKNSEIKKLDMEKQR